MNPAVPLYGMGERKFALRLQPGIKYQLWNRGPTGTEYLNALYGYHPFLLALASPTGAGAPARAHGVFMLSSNAMVLDGCAWIGAGDVHPTTLCRVRRLSAWLEL